MFITDNFMTSLSLKTSPRGGDFPSLQPHSKVGIFQTIACMNLYTIARFILMQFQL